MPNKPPTQQEIDAVLDQCSEAEAKGTSRFPGLTYEEGVSCAIRWMLRESEDPLQD
jgi:hypothetical protein